MRKRVMFQAIAILLAVAAAADRRQRLRPRLGPAQQDLHPHRRCRRDRPGRRLARLQGRSAHGRDRRCRRGEQRDRRRLARTSRTARRGRCSAGSRTNCSISAPISPRRARISRRRMRCASLPEQVERLEREIDAMNEDAGAAAQLHPARRRRRRGRAPPRPRHRRAGPSARRSPRREAALNPLALTYLNRLSDHLFVLARWVAREQGGDILWQPGATRGA